MDITQVSKQSGMPASTLRYYEEKGLIKSVGRHGLRRLFGCDILQRLALISLGRNAGFSLNEIAQMFKENGTSIDKRQLRAKAEELDKHITQLIAMRDGLHHAANCDAPSHLECPNFQRLLQISQKRQRKTILKVSSK